MIIADSVRFAKNVSKINNDEYANKENSILVRKTTPKWMLKANCNQLPISITYNHIRNALGIGNRGHQHNISIKVLSMLPMLINKPIVSFTSHDNTIVAILNATDKDGKVVVTAIKPNGKSYLNYITIESNHILSIYGRNNLYYYIERILKNEKILYPFNKIKKQIIQDVQGLQLPNDFLSSAMKIFYHIERFFVK